MIWNLHGGLDIENTFFLDTYIPVEKIIVCFLDFSQGGQTLCNKVDDVLSRGQQND